MLRLGWFLAKNALCPAAVGDGDTNVCFQQAVWQGREAGPPIEHYASATALQWTITRLYPSRIPKRFESTEQQDRQEL